MKRISLFVLFIISFTLSFEAQTKFATTGNLKIELQKIQKLYFKRDFTGGSDLAGKLLEKYPDSLELKAWQIINLARKYDSTSVGMAEKFVQQRGETFWTLLALTTAQAYNKSATSLPTAEKLIKIAPTDEEAIFAYQTALFQNSKYKETVEWLEKNKNQVKDQSRFLTELARATYYSESKKEKGDKQIAFALFAQAVKLDPASVNANYFYGSYLTLDKKHDEAIPFLRKAVDLSPHGESLLDKYWRTIEAQTGKTEMQKKTELEQAINRYLAQTKNSPEALLAAWGKYRNLTGWKDQAKAEDLKKRDYFEKMIQQKYPNTKYDEEIAFTQINSLYGKHFAKDENAKYLEIHLKRKSKRTPEEVNFYEQYRSRDKIYKLEQTALQRNFLKRAKHYDLSKLGNVQLNLFSQLAGEAETSDEEISVLLKGTLENNKSYYGNLTSYVSGMLFNRQKKQPASLIAQDAEKYARLGVEEAEKKIKELPKDAKPAKIYELQLEPVNNLANILISQGKLAEAEQLLTQASAMKEDSGGQNFVLEYGNNYTKKLWADYYTAQKDWDKAEELYINSSSENEDTLWQTFENFYQKKTGKQDGFAEYFAAIQNRLKAAAREKIVQSRIKNAKELVPFTLKTIDDKPFSSNELKGKVVVINIWGVWCGPCVAEMPELQKLYEKYKDDKDVAILTLDSNDELATVRKFMADKKYTLPVLIDDNYVTKLPEFKNFAAYPTTLFIDKSGKVSFVVVGASADLFDTFSWRIDALKIN